MPTVGRKLLMAGRGGLNLTHAEPADAFRARYGRHLDALAPFLDRFDADAVRRWAAGLGIAYRGKPVAREAARARIEACGLTAALYMQGYRRDEFAR